MAHFYKHAHIFDLKYTERQLETYKETLAFQTIHSMSTSGSSPHDVEELASKKHIL